MDNLDDEESAEPVLMAIDQVDMVIDDIQPSQPEDECYCGSDGCKSIKLSAELDAILNPNVGVATNLLSKLWPLLAASSSSNSPTSSTSTTTQINPRDQISDYLDKLEEYRVERQCCLAWAPNYVAYRCRTCSKALTMALCADCFRAGDHQGHDYNMFRSRSGGACDCGHSIMASSGHCIRHGKKARAKRQDEPIPKELTCSASRAMPRIIHRLAIQLRRSHVDLPGEVDSYLDDLIKLGNSSAVLRSLMVDAMISEKTYSSQLRLLQNHPEKEVASIVKEGLKKLKREQKGLIPFKLPDWAKDRKLPQMINAFCDTSQRQQSTCTTFVEELIFWVIVFEFPQKLVCFLLGLLVDERYKLIFSRAFVNNYPRIITTLTYGNRSEPRRHFRDSYEQLSRRILQVSVQIYNEKDLITQLCREDYVLHVIIYCLRVAIEGYGNPVDGIRGCLKVNPLRRDDWPESSPPKVVNCDTTIIRDRHLTSFTDDLSAILEREDVAQQLAGSPELLDIWLAMVSYFQTMSPYKRELNEHTPYDTGPHISVFLIENDFCIAPMWQLLAHFRSKETGVWTNNLASSVHKALAIWFHKMSMRPDSLLDRYHMSFHIPLHRMLAATLRQMIYQQDRRDLEDVYEMLTRNQSSYGELFGHKATSGSQIKTSISDFMKMLLLHPLQALTFYHETRSAMWTRNGLMTINQALTYVSNSLCKSTIDLDMFLLRYCASKLDPNYFLHVLLSRFHAWQWLSFKSNQVMGSLSTEVTSADIQRFYNFNIMPEQVLQMVESALVTLIQLLTLSIHCNTSEREQTKQEMIALISVADRPYSHLEMSMLEQNGLDSERSEFDYLLEELTIFKRAQHGYSGSNLQQGCYTLRPEVWNNDYNPIQVQYRFYQKREYQLSLERFFQHSRLTGKLDKRFHSSVLWPPLKLPISTSTNNSTSDTTGSGIGQFGQLDLSPLLECQALLGSIYSILFKSVYVSEIPDTIMAYTIHLLELSLRKAIEKSSQNNLAASHNNESQQSKSFERDQQQEGRRQQRQPKVSSVFEGKFHYANLNGTSIEEIGTLKMEAAAAATMSNAASSYASSTSHTTSNTTTTSTQLPVDRNVVGYPIYCQERKVELATPSAQLLSQSSSMTPSTTLLDSNSTSAAATATTTTLATPPDEDLLFPVVNQALDLAFESTWFPFESSLDNCLVHIVDVHSLPRKEFDLLLRPPTSKVEYWKRRASGLGGGGSRSASGTAGVSRGAAPRSTTSAAAADGELMDASMMADLEDEGLDEDAEYDEAFYANRWAAVLETELDASEGDDGADDDDDEDDDDYDEDDDEDDEDDDDYDGDYDNDRPLYHNAGHVASDLSVGEQVVSVTAARQQQNREQQAEQGVEQQQHDNVVSDVVLIDPTARNIHRLRNREANMLDPRPADEPIVTRQTVRRVPISPYSPMATGNNNNNQLPVTMNPTTTTDHTYSAPDSDRQQMEVESLPESQSAALSLVPASSVTSVTPTPELQNSTPNSAVSEQVWPENLVTEPRRAILAQEPRQMIEGSTPQLALEGTQATDQMGQLRRITAGRWTSQLVDRAAAAQQQLSAQGRDAASGISNQGTGNEGQSQQVAGPQSGQQPRGATNEERSLSEVDIQTRFMGFFSSGSGNGSANAASLSRLGAGAPMRGLRVRQTARRSGGGAIGPVAFGGGPRTHLVNQPEVYTPAAAVAAVTQAAAALGYYRPDPARIFNRTGAADTAPSRPAPSAGAPSGVSGQPSTASRSPTRTSHPTGSARHSSNTSSSLGGPRWKITNKRVFGRTTNQQRGGGGHQRQRTRMRKDQMRHSESLLTLLLRLHAKYSQRPNSYHFDPERAKANLNPETRTRIGDGVHFVTIALDLICASDVDRMCAKLAHLQSLIWPQSVLAASTFGSASVTSTASMGTTMTATAMMTIDSEIQMESEESQKFPSVSVKQERDARLPVSQSATVGETKLPSGEPTKSLAETLTTSTSTKTPATSTMKITDAAERRRRAREYQSKLMAEFASKQRAFIENYEPSGAKAHGSGSVAKTAARLAESATTTPADTPMVTSSAPTSSSETGDPASCVNLEQPINLSGKSSSSSTSMTLPRLGQQIESPQDPATGATQTKTTMPGEASTRTIVTKQQEQRSSSSTLTPMATDKASTSTASTSKTDKVESATSCRDFGSNATSSSPLECCICGLEASGDSQGANPLGQVVLLQSSSVWGHAHLRTAEHRRLPADDRRVQELREETYAKYLERRIDLLSEYFSESSWLDAINIGAEGGVHVQSCGHQLHVECHQSYLRSLDQEDRLRGRNDSNEFLCPVCRQLANSVLPILESNTDESSGRHSAIGNSSDLQSPARSNLPPEVEASSRSGDDSSGNLDELSRMYSEVADQLKSRKLPDQRHLQSSAAFCDHVTKATSAQFRCVRAEASMHSLFLFLASIARSNLETEVLVRSTRAAESVAKRSCLKLLLHVLALNAQTLIDANWFTCPQIWSHLTNEVEANDRFVVKPANSEVPLLLRDPTAMLLQFLFAITSSQLSKRRHFLALTRALFNLTVVQSIALALSYLMPDCSESAIHQSESDHCSSSSSSSSSSFGVSGRAGNRGQRRRSCEARESDEPQLMSLDLSSELESADPVVAGSATTPTPAALAATHGTQSSNDEQQTNKSQDANERRSQHDGHNTTTAFGCCATKPKTASLGDGHRQRGESTKNYTHDGGTSGNFVLLIKLVGNKLAPLLSTSCEQKTQHQQQIDSWDLRRSEQLPVKEVNARSSWRYLEALKLFKSSDTQLDRVETLVQLACLPYLRAATLLQHHLYGNDYPKMELSLDETPDSTAKISADFRSLTSALNLLSGEATEGSSFVGATLRWPQLDLGWQTVESWTNELLRFGHKFPIAASSLLIRRSLVWHRPSLMLLPHSFDEIFSHYYRRKCTLCDQVPKDVAVCLVCGAPICFRVNCCKDRSRSRQIHSQHCGANTAVLLAIHTSSVVVIRGARACVWGSVYLDSHDEEDNGLQRGKPLYLVKERYQLLGDHWLTHSFDHHCSRRWIYLQDNQ